MKLNYFNFRKFDNKILMTNDFGEYVFISEEEFKRLLKKKITPNSDLYDRLIQSNMIYEEDGISYSSKSRYKLMDKKNHLIVATSLHIFVVTTACNMNCVYCQANSGRNSTKLYMNKATAEKAVDIALKSTAKFLEFEFQGGEPLLNFEIIKHIVEYTEKHKEQHKVHYNIVSNLTLLTDEIINFLQIYNFGISTSLDGSKEIHDNNRVFINGKGTYDIVTEKLDVLRQKKLHVGAIETTTKYALSKPIDLVNEYSTLGFEGIFIRPLTPLGKADNNWNKIGYDADEFINFYRTALEEIIEINKSGVFFREEHATIFLRKLFGQFVNYMELRSPCGAAIGQLAYYCDGNIFTCDEGRMLYEMGIDSFKLGNVYENTYEDLIKSKVCKTVCSASILETIPSCTDCVYQPYCGVCPVVNYAMNNDLLEKQPREYRCKIYSGILDCIFEKLLEDNSETINIFKLWCN